MHATPCSEAGKKRRILDHAESMLQALRDATSGKERSESDVDGERFKWCLILTRLVLAREDRRFGAIGEGELRDKLKEARRNRWGPAQLAFELSELAGLGDTLAAYKQAATRTRRGAEPKGER